MIREKIYLCLLTISLISFVVLPVNAAPTLNLNPSDSYIQVGDTFNVDVLLSDDAAGDEFLAFGFDVVDLFGVSYLGYALGPIFDPFDDVSDPANIYNVSAIAPLPSIVAPFSTFQLATLSFQAISNGTGHLGIYGDYPADPPIFAGLVYNGYDLSFPLGYDLGYDINAGLDFTIHDAGQPVPEPTTMLLLGSGLVGLAGFKKKFKKK